MDQRGQTTRKLDSSNLNSKAGRISKGPMSMCCNWQLVFASIQKTTPTCCCFYYHIRRSRWSWVSPGGTRVSQSPIVSWTVSLVDRSLVRWYARSQPTAGCSFVSAIADSLACSIVATAFASLSLPIPIPFISSCFL